MFEATTNNLSVSIAEIVEQGCLRGDDEQFVGVDRFARPDQAVPRARLIAVCRAAAGGKSLLGAHSCTNARLRIMSDISGLGSVAGTPMHSVDSVRTVFRCSRGIFSASDHTRTMSAVASR
jgi:hypothetical protein